MFRRVLPLVFFAITVSSCGKDASPTQPTPPPAPTVTAVAVSAATTDLEVGQSTTVTAVATFSNGTTGATTVTWESDNVNVATVSQERQVRAVGPGTATIIGRSASGLAGTVLVRVRAVGPRTRFGSGSHRVGADIAAGRYFSDPVSGCYWERVSGFGGTLGEIIANDFVGYNPSQYIVDVLASDAGFVPDAQCGTWDVSPLRGSSTTVVPGIWLVGAQVPPGTYRASAAYGCYWERVRDFQGRLQSIISNDFVAAAGTVRVTISAGDVGFSTDGDCGTWTLESGASALGAAPASATDVRANFDLARRKKGLR